MLRLNVSNHDGKLLNLGLKFFLIINLTFASTVGLPNLAIFINLLLKKLLLLGMFVFFQFINVNFFLKNIYLLWKLRILSI